MNATTEGSPLAYVIDNRGHKLAYVLTQLLRGEAVHALDVATAYFNVGGYNLLREGLEGLALFRLLLGSEPGEARAGRRAGRGEHARGRDRGPVHDRRLQEGDHSRPGLPLHGEDGGRGTTDDRWRDNVQV
jgi:hypothetical protein